MQQGLPEGYNYCRKCQSVLTPNHFYDCVDEGFIDSNKKMSVCKKCLMKMYDEIHEETESMEKTIHKMCTSLNVRYSNEAMSATRSHINTLIEKGKNVRSIFGIYKTKLIATQKSMDKSSLADMTYEDVATIFTKEEIDTPEIAISKEVLDFWGADIPAADILYLEREFANFKQTHKSDTYAEIVLLKNVCHTMLNLKKARQNQDATKELVKELQELMKALAISPKESVTKNTGVGEQTFGLWIKDIEKQEPAQWLKSDARGDMYRDVADVDKYFQKYVVRATKNFITMSKDFNIEDDNQKDDFIDDYDDDTDFGLNDGEE